jgi:hypothetical protein
MSVVAIDRTKGSRKVFLHPHELAEQIDAWRRAQRPIPSESAAIAELVRQALERWRKKAAPRER